MKFEPFNSLSAKYPNSLYKKRSISVKFFRLFPWPLIVTFRGDSSFRFPLADGEESLGSWLMNLVLKGDWLREPSYLSLPWYSVGAICLFLIGFCCWFISAGLFLFCSSTFMVLLIGEGGTVWGLTCPPLSSLSISLLMVSKNLTGVSLSLRSLLKHPAKIFLIYSLFPQDTRPAIKLLLI